MTRGYYAQRCALRKTWEVPRWVTARDPRTRTEHVFVNPPYEKPAQRNDIVDALAYGMRWQSLLA